MFRRKQFLALQSNRGELASKHVAKPFLIMLLWLGLGQTANANESDEAKKADERAQIAACQVRLSDALRAEDTPLMKALAVLQYPSWDLGGAAAVADRSEQLKRIARSVPDDLLVQWLAAADAQPDAGLSKAAKNLLRLEPDNGAVWLYPLQAAWIANDTDGVTEAVVHISQANRFDDHFGDIAVHGFKFFKKHPSICGSYTDSRRPMVMGMQLAHPAWFWPVGRKEDDRRLDRMCGGEQEPLSIARRDACIAAGNRVAEIGARPLLRGSAISLFLRDVAPDDFATNSSKVQYLMEEYIPISRATMSDDNQYRLFEMDMLDTHNCIKVMERALLRSGKPAVMPEGWKMPVGPVTEEILETTPS